MPAVAEGIAIWHVAPMDAIDQILERAAQLGINQGEPENRAGLTQGRISKWKAGKGQPYFAQVVALARVVGASLDEIAGLGVGPRTPDEVLLWRVVSRIGAQTAFDLLMDALPRPRVRLEPPSEPPASEGSPKRP